MPTGGRKTQLPLIHEISMLFGPGSVGGGVLGVLPASSLGNTLHIFVQTAFNSTTNTVNIGTTPGGSQVIGTDLKTISRNDGPVQIAIAGPLAFDTPIYWSVVSTGPAPTVGLAGFWLDYLPGPG